MPTVAEPKALPIAKFARAYGVSRSTIWRAVKEGRMQFVGSAGGS
jgi:hypothetical protein